MRCSRDRGSMNCKNQNQKKKIKREKFKKSNSVLLLYRNLALFQTIHPFHSHLLPFLSLYSLRLLVRTIHSAFRVARFRGVSTGMASAAGIGCSLTTISSFSVDSDGLSPAIGRSFRITFDACPFFDFGGSTFGFVYQSQLQHGGM